LEVILDNVPATTPVPTQPVKPRSKFGSFVLETLQTVILAVVLYFLIDTVVARVRVENISMEPTLQSGEFVLVDKLAYRIGDIHRGDIIVFHYPQDPSQDYIKRIIGVAGDVIDVHDQNVYVNNQALVEPYIMAEPLYNGSWTVPPNDLFVLGDNRNESSDSHYWGFVPDANVVGRAMVIYWPLSDLKILDQPIVVKAAN
jgi:signal peptidase I